MEATPDLEFVLHVNGEDHPVRLAETTARQAGELQVLFGGVTPLGLAAALVSQRMGPFELAALLYLSARQAGREANADELLDAITAGTPCSVTYPDGIDPADPADPDADPEG